MELKITYKNGDVKSFPLNADTKLYCLCQPDGLTLQNNIINCGLQYREIWADIKEHGAEQVNNVAFTTDRITTTMTNIARAEYQVLYRATYDEYLYFKI